MIHDHDDHVLTSALSVRYEECDKIMRIVMMIMVTIISIIQSDNHSVPGQRDDEERD